MKTTATFAYDRNGKPLYRTDTIDAHATSAHFWQWIAREYGDRREEGLLVVAAILDYLREYPDLPETRSWPEIRSLAFRYKEKTT